MKRRRRTVYTQGKDGDVFLPTMEGEGAGVHKIACCDCGLVHRFTFAVVKYRGKNRVAFSAVRDNRATAARRRKKR
jgi:hypothetical protein